MSFSRGGHPISLFFFWFLFFLPVAQAGETQGRAGTNLEDVVVRPLPGSRSTSSDAATPAVSVTPAHIRKGGMSVVPLLEGESGITVRHYGGLGNFSTLSIRGSRPEQVQVSLDGIPLDRGSGAAFDLGQVAPLFLDGIEVTKGFASPSHPRGSMGGSVALKTPPVVPGPAFRIGIGYGSFGTVAGQTRASFGTRGGYGVLAGYSYGKSDGDFQFTDDRGTPLAAEDDAVVARQNNRQESHQGLVKGVMPVRPDLVFTLEDFVSRRHQGVPGLGSNTSSVASLGVLDNAASGALTLGTASPPFERLTVSGFLSFEQDRYSDPKGEIGLGLQETETTYWHYGVEGGWAGELSRSHEWRGGLHLGQELYAPFNSLAANPAGSPSRREVVAAWLADRWSLADGAVEIAPSLRSEHIFNHLSGDDSTLAGSDPNFQNGAVYHPLSGRLGLSWQVSDPFVLTANVSRSERPPSFSELFGDRGWVQGNPVLRPESGWNWDAGVKGEMGLTRGWNAGWKAAYFEHRSSDLIQFIQTSQFTARAENMASALARGIEIEAQASYGDRLTTSLDYTFQDVRNTSGLPGVDGKFLPGRPRHELKLDLDGAWRSIGPFASLRFVDGTFLDSQNLFLTKTRLLVGAGVRIRFLKNFETRLEGRNLLDDPIVDVLGYPLPGRSFLGEVRYEV